MSNALTAAVESMQGDLRYLDTISQNMVNIATPGYRRAIPSSQVFDDALRVADPAHTAVGKAAPASMQPLLDLSTGPVKPTGKPLDLAISGEGFFEVETPHGLSYTRGGDFHLAADGRLVTASGFSVQGLGGDIILNGPEASIDIEGKVLQDGAIIGQLKIVQFSKEAQLYKAPSGLLQPRLASDASVVSYPTLQTGHLESSNVAPMREMVMMMQTTRHFEAAQKLYQGYDDMLSTAIRKLGEF